jgi:hypothetical protein
MSTTITEARKSGKRCGCGCSDCKGECCELDCLVQPRFFCGQLLTDQDLSALLEWTKGKTALTRYRSGWGAVCGLEVHCDSQRGEEAYVSVAPGYAIDCCGNDVIVCKKARLDLSSYCKSEEDPCGDWPPKPEVPDNRVINIGGWELPMSQVQAVDIYVRYSETVSDARTALAKGSCSPVETCEYTRTQEGYELYAKRADHCDHKAEQAVMDWLDGYRNGLKEVYGSLPRPDAVGQQAILEKLSYWIKHHTLNTFCFVREWVCDLVRKNQVPTPEVLSKIAFWIIQDWRNNYLRCNCYGCGPDTGVPLARVWLWRQEVEGGRKVCKVVYVNSYPPFRRPMHLECWPAPAGSVNLGRFIWQPLDDVFTELRNLGIDRLTPERFQFSSIENMMQQIGQEKLFVPRLENSEETPLVVYYYDDNCGQARVILFGVGSRPELSLPKDNVELTDDNPAFDMRRVRGIGSSIDAKLKQEGIRNLRQLSEASPEMVVKALSSIRVSPPDEARSRKFIDDARGLLNEMKKGK